MILRIFPQLMTSLRRDHSIFWHEIFTNVCPNDCLLAGILFLTLLFIVINLWGFENSRNFAKKRLSHYISIYQSQKQSLYPRAPLKSLENPLMFGSRFCTKNLEIVTIGFLVKFQVEIIVILVFKFNHRKINFWSRDLFMGSRDGPWASKISHSDST